MEWQADSFEFKKYQISKDRTAIDFIYQLIFKDGKKLDFIEKIFLPQAIPSTVSSNLLNKVLENLHLILGISYYKLYCPRNINTQYFLTEEQINFWNTVYTKGLGEFFYKNKIDFRGLGLVDFGPVPESRERSTIQGSTFKKEKDKTLIGIGGGKDSIVMAELLKEQRKNITGYVLKNKNSDFAIQKKVLELMRIDYLVVEREMDKKLFNLNKKPGSFNGHVPISAIYAFTGLFLALIYGFSEVILAQEKSANEGNVKYLGETINHQWSKSEEFEQMFQRYVKRFVTSEVTTYSILRKYSELEIIKEFAKQEKYFSVFSSCNKNSKINNKIDKLWCGQCAKCAFVFLTLAAYLPKDKIIKIFGKNLFADESLLPLYKDLLGRGQMKPFDCVGTFKEANEALSLVISKGEFNEDIIIKNLNLDLKT